MDKRIILEKVVDLRKLFAEGKIPQIHKHEVNPELPLSDRLNYLYFTLPVSLNFQRNSPAMWKAALETYNDPETNYLFYPELVIEKEFVDIQSALIKHKLGLQRNKHTDIWVKLCSTFARNYENDPRTFFQKHHYNVNKIINALRVDEKKDFPYISGAKMANYWLYILHSFTDAKFEGLENISIIPDTHVRQASTVLGLISGDESPDEIAEIWFTLLDGADILPIDMHPILWNWSRAGFKPEI